MAKRQRSITKNKIEKWLKDGRGQGLDIDYKPWLTVQDVSSNGRAHRELGIKVPRQYEFLSDLEDRYFHILEFCNEVVDIREQFPLLPREETIYIAEELGVKHPTDPFSGENIVMTTDFLITVIDRDQRKLLARTVKKSSDLSSERTIEKFEIERRFWEKHEVDWGIVTEREINCILADNIKSVRNYYDLIRCGLKREMPEQQIKSYISQLSYELCGKSICVRDICFEFDERHSLKSGTSLGLFKHLVATKQIEIDLINQPIELSKPVIINLRQQQNLNRKIEAI